MVICPWWRTWIIPGPGDERITPVLLSFTSMGFGIFPKICSSLPGPRFLGEVPGRSSVGFRFPEQGLFQDPRLVPSSG